MKKALLVSLLLGLLLTPAVYAKDKEYNDGTLLEMHKFRPDLMTSLQAVAAGYHINPSWLFTVQVGDWQYGVSVEKRWVNLNEAEWPANSPLKIRFDIKGGAVATRTQVHIKRADGKEVEGDILLIQDKNGKADYCGTRKCDPVSAAKKYEKEHGM